MCFILGPVSMAANHFMWWVTLILEHYWSFTGYQYLVTNCVSYPKVLVISLFVILSKCCSPSFRPTIS
jgi:hypothetical protein